MVHADLKSGFGDIKESIVLGAAKKLSKALGDFEQGEYTLAEQYQQYLSKDVKKWHREVMEQLERVHLRCEAFRLGRTDIRWDEYIDIVERALEIFYQYELQPGKHTLKMVVKNPVEDVVIEMGDLITYTKN